MFSDGGDFFFFSYAHYLLLYLWAVSSGAEARMYNSFFFCTFHCICVNNSINRSCEPLFSFFHSCSLCRKDIILRSEYT